ncbi:MAG: hypothetical protein FGF53_08495, partial [Candidatus Brockarchaeota archaeon]|nr:hypothetical protein [Candidatus Brockarchaeota archaeon]
MVVSILPPTKDEVTVVLPTLN